MDNPNRGVRNRWRAMGKPFKINRGGGVEFLGVCVGRVSKKNPHSGIWIGWSIAGRIASIEFARVAAAAELCKSFVLEHPAEAAALRPAADNKID